MADKVSIYDIAELAGLSAGSVSKILNNKGNFSQKTRERVMQIAKEQGYVANFAAKTLRDACTKTIAIMTPDVSNDFFSSIILIVEQLMREQGYTSYICSYSNDPEVEDSSVRSLLARQVDGFVFVGGRHSLDPQVLGIPVPCVSIDRFVVDGSKAVMVVNDGEALTHDATEVLVKHGCTSLAFVNVSAGADTEAGGAILAGFRRALAEANSDDVSSFLLESRHRAPSFVEAEGLIDKCLASGGRPDGIMAVGDRVALGTINALMRHGLVPGKDVLVMGVDNSLYSRITTPAISSVDREIENLAQEGVRAMLTLLGGEEPAEWRIIVPHHVIERATTLGVA